MSYFLRLCLCFLFSCDNSFKNRYVPARYEVLAEEIMKQMEEKLSKKYHMRVVADRVGLYDQVNLLGFNFYIRGPLTQEELRVILIGCVEEFLFSLNNNEEIRPYLKSYPFTADGIDIIIFSKDSKSNQFFHPYIGLAEAYEGRLIYRTIDAESGTKYISTIVESYEDALQIVQNTKS